MDANTRFLIARMDEHRHESKKDLERVEQALCKKIDVLWAFRLRILGASMVISAVAGGLVTIVIEVLRK